ncbi:MAG TPA: alpha/beta hydrolase domain-containing protein [Gemmatimonadales bacterium]|nr:alpha/beta hydrolase domain-containing protein [Gemmatimonadales bacterium]
MFAPARAAGDVVRVEVDRREVIGGGTPWGDAGPYERLVGRVFFEFDPTDPHDLRITDLALAPRNARGKVEVWAQFVIYKPLDPARGSGVTLFEIPNRGGGSGIDVPATVVMQGENAYILRMGATVVYLGWQFDAPATPPGLRLHAPTVTEDGRMITGLVRAYWVVEARTTTLPVSAAVSYPVLDPGAAGHALLVRDTWAAEPRLVPRGAWSFARVDDGQLVEDATHTHLSTGFTPGKIYELVYRAANPVLVGAGLAAVRDLAEYLKYDPQSIAPSRHVIARGFSQSGRFLRHFLYEGFNVGAAGRRVFDGMYIVMAGGSRGSFNHRFAQPTTASGQYPTRIFPFAGVELSDPVTGVRDGLLARAGSAVQLPKIFYVDGGHEYWGNAASLTHTAPDGARDVPLMPNERRYVLASADHTPNARELVPPTDARLPGSPAYRGNPLEARPVQRALFRALVEWVRDNRLPPPSSHPTIASGTLVPADSVRFPRIPGVAFPRAAVPVYRLDLGPRWSQGIVEREPPRLGAPFPVRVGQVDSVGNELGGLRTLEVAVPLATYFPWQLRTDSAAVTTPLVSNEGSIVPLAATEAARQAAGDPRPSVERLYRNRQDYLARVRRVVQQLVDERFLLAEDAPGELARAESIWAWVTGRGGDSERQ